jgi:hypothetical protein
MISIPIFKARFTCERDTSEFEAACYWKLLEKAWEEVEFVLLNDPNERTK